MSTTLHEVEPFVPSAAGLDRRSDPDLLLRGRRVRDAPRLRFVQQVQQQLPQVCRGRGIEGGEGTTGLDMRSIGIVFNVQSLHILEQMLIEGRSGERERERERDVGGGFRDSGTPNKRYCTDVELYSRDCIATACVNSFTSIFSGFVIFSYLGYMAHRQGATDIDKVAEEGASGWGHLFVHVRLCVSNWTP